MKLHIYIPFSLLHFFSLLCHILFFPFSFLVPLSIFNLLSFSFSGAGTSFAFVHSLLSIHIPPQCISSTFHFCLFHILSQNHKITLWMRLAVTFETILVEAGTSREMYLGPCTGSFWRCPKRRLPNLWATYDNALSPEQHRTALWWTERISCTPVSPHYFWAWHCELLKRAWLQLPCTLHFPASLLFVSLSNFLSVSLTSFFFLSFIRCLHFLFLPHPFFISWSLITLTFTVLSSFLLFVVSFHYFFFFTIILVFLLFSSSWIYFSLSFHCFWPYPIAEMTAYTLCQGRKHCCETLTQNF